MRRMAILIPAAIFALIMVALFSTSQSPATGRMTFTPPQTAPTYADPRSVDVGEVECTEEDGYGQALCMWDGVLSGDCAPEYLGSSEASELCVKLHSMGQEGIDNALECIDTYNTITDDQATREGWTVTECFKAMV